MEVALWVILYLKYCTIQDVSSIIAKAMKNIEEGKPMEDTVKRVDHRTEIRQFLRESQYSSDNNYEVAVSMDKKLAIIYKFK